jgi:hypothetical protein
VKRLFCSAFLVGALTATPLSVFAQSRPLATEDPETVPAGFILLETGIDFLHGVTFPVSGLTGKLSRLGTFGVSFGVGSLAEIQVDGSLLNTLKITALNVPAPLAPLYTGDAVSTSSFGDLTVGAKVRIVTETETRPGLAVRFATQLPINGPSTGIGSSTTDFTVGLAIGKTVESVRVVGNVGLGILGDPLIGHRQNHLLMYGVSIARAMGKGAELVAEMNGRIDTGSDVPPLGTDSLMIVRVGGRFTHKSVRFDGGLLIGVTDRDPAWGFTVGATWVFKAFDVK